MKLIQLNSWGFNCGEDLLDFIATEQPDILNLQEVTTADFTGFIGKSLNKKEGVNYFQQLQQKFGLQGRFYPTFGLKEVDGSVGYFGNAFLTKLPILDYYCQYEPNSGPLIITREHGVYAAKTKQEKVVYCWDLPVTILTATLEYQGRLLRNITTHFRVTHNCSETPQTVTHARSLREFVVNSKDLPTILSGDFNIFPESYSMQILEQVLTMVNKGSPNTLNPKIHPAILNGDLPNGVTVDYIFQKGFSVQTWKIPEVTVSDHLPIVAELELE